MTEDGTRPDALAGLREDQIVELDVRADLREGREPFQRIMSAKEQVGPGGALMLRAIFEPAPLYRVLGNQGFEHDARRLADDDWVVWFWRPTGADAGSAGSAEASAGAGVGVAGGRARAGAAAEDPGRGDDGVVVLDVRGLEPPEPMVRTLAALESLPRGSTLVQINVREPKFLLPKLEENGFAYEVREQARDLVRVFIRHADDVDGVAGAADAADAAGGADADVPSAGGRARSERVLDVRPIPPREKHPAIFETFGGLGAGESFVLVNDHDPKPLRYQFEFEHPGEYGWEYLEQGPAVWRVEISRVTG